MTSKIESLNIQHKECVQKHVQLVSAVEHLQAEWRDAVAVGESDDELQPLESAIDGANRDVERAAIRVESARNALEFAEKNAAQAEAKKAADAFLTSDKAMREAIAEIDAAGREYAMMVTRLKPLGDDYFQRMNCAKQLASFPAIDALPLPYDVRAAASIANGTPSLLNSRASA